MIKVQCMHLQTVAKTMPESNVHRGDVELGGLQNHSYYHNVSIQLSSLRRPFSDLCKALNEIDQQVLTSETLHVLMRTLPTKEDICLLKEC